MPVARLVRPPSRKGLTASAVQDIPRVASTPGLHVLEGPALRTVFLGMDEARAELTDSPLRGRNPFQDLRVRRALIGEALRIHRDEVGQIPLHQLFLAWGARAGLTTP